MKNKNNLITLFKSFIFIQAIALFLVPISASAVGGTSYNLNFTKFVQNEGSVEIGGNASSTNPYTAPNTHNIRVDWGDGTISDKSNIMPDDGGNFADDGSGNFYGDWTNSHTYATSGKYTIKVAIYGADEKLKGQLELTRAVDIVVPEPITGTLVVNKIVTGGGPLTPDTTELFVDDSPVSHGVATTTLVGNHVVSETPVANYFPIFTGDCDENGNVTVSEGQESVCYLINRYVPVTEGHSYSINTLSAKINVAKVDINGDASSGNPYTDPNTHNVKVDWGDGSVSTTSTITPDDGGNFKDLGSRNFYGTWKNDHTYATSGIYTIKVSLHNNIEDIISTERVVNITIPETKDPNENSTTTVSTTTEQKEENTSSSRRSGSRRNAPTNSLAGQVLGASTEEEVCPAGLKSFLKKGFNNPADQVIILQNFLNKELSLSIPSTGFFGNITEEAVKQFQLKYKEDVLKPWVDVGLMSNDEVGTGYVYKTTQRQINLILCPTKPIPFPVLN